jgi:hypothetical protein
MGGGGGASNGCRQVQVLRAKVKAYREIMVSVPPHDPVCLVVPCCELPLHPLCVCVFRRHKCTIWRPQSRASRGTGIAPVSCCETHCFALQKSRSRVHSTVSVALWHSRAACSASVLCRYCISPHSVGGGGCAVRGDRWDWSPIYATFFFSFLGVPCPSAGHLPQLPRGLGVHWLPRPVTRQLDQGVCVVRGTTHAVSLRAADAVRCIEQGVPRRGQGFPWGVVVSCRKCPPSCVKPL